MPKDTITLGLEGDIPFADFAESMVHLHGLIKGLTEAVAKGAKIDWSIASLEAGSAIATIRGTAQEHDVVDRVVDAYSVVGQDLESNRPIRFSREVRKHALALRDMLNGRIVALRLETSDKVVIVRSQVDIDTAPAVRSAYGAIEGRIQSMSNRKGLRFILYESLDDRPVACYLDDEEQQELLRNLWGQRSIVAGWVTRDGVTGQPLSIRRVERIHPLAEVHPGSYRDAAGIIPFDPEGELPEDAIRRIRDADRWERDD